MRFARNTVSDAQRTQCDRTGQGAKCQATQEVAKPRKKKWHLYHYRCTLTFLKKGELLESYDRKWISPSNISQKMYDNPLHTPFPQVFFFVSWSLPTRKNQQAGRTTPVAMRNGPHMMGNELLPSWAKKMGRPATSSSPREGRCTVPSTQRAVQANSLILQHYSPVLLKILAFLLRLCHILSHLCHISNTFGHNFVTNLPLFAPKIKICLHILWSRERVK